MKNIFIKAAAVVVITSASAFSLAEAFTVCKAVYSADRADVFSPVDPGSNRVFCAQFRTFKGNDRSAEANATNAVLSGSGVNANCPGRSSYFSNPVFKGCAVVNAPNRNEAIKKAKNRLPK